MQNNSREGHEDVNATEGVRARLASIVSRICCGLHRQGDAHCGCLRFAVRATQSSTIVIKLVEARSMCSTYPILPTPIFEKPRIVLKIITIGEGDGTPIFITYRNSK